MVAQCPSGLSITESAAPSGVCGEILTLTGAFSADAFIEWSTGVSGIASDGADVTHFGRGLGSPTTYTVTVTEPVSGCSETATIVDAIAPLPSVTAVVENPSSCGTSDGNITLSASGGPDGFTWSNPAFNNQSSINGVPAGVYGVTVQYDGGMCEVPMVITLASDAEPMVTLTQEPDCSGGNTNPDGVINVNINGGTPPYDLAWDDSTLDIMNDADGIVTYTGIEGGITYDVTITDGNSCTTTGNILVREPRVPVIDRVENTTLCSGLSTDLFVAGTDFQTASIVKWTYPDGTMVSDARGNGGNFLNGVTEPGNYMVEVTRTEGCSDTFTFDVVEAAFSIDLTNMDDCPANGVDDGEIMISVTEGTGPYDFDWDVDALDILADADGMVNYTNLAVGTYNVTITDTDSGCSITENVLIEEAIQPEITAINGGPVLCAGGALTLSVAGLNFEGNPDAIVTWTLPDGTMVTETVGNGGRNLSSVSQLGTYNVTVTRPNGCSDQSSIFISQNDPIVIDRTGSTPSCDGSVSATQTISVVGGTPPYEYDWDIDGVGDFDDMPTSPPFAPTTNITVVVRDAAGCTEALVLSRANYKAPNIEIIQTAISCINGTAELTIIDNDSNPASFGGGATIAWSEGTMGSTTTGEDIINVSSAGTYSVTVTKLNGCSTVASIDVTSVPDLNIELTNAVATCLGENSGTIDVTVTGGTPPYDFDWNNDGSGDFDDTEDLSGLPPNTYMLTVRDADGCTASTMATVEEENTTISITNLFTGSCQGDSISFFAVIEYTDPPATGTIEVTADGQTKNIAIGVNNPFYVQFNILADDTGALVEAGFTDINCSTTAMYNQRIDCSEVAPACSGDAVGGSLYVDYNNDGIQDPNEYGEFGFQVIVYDENNVIICNTMTDHFGNFTCPGLTAGQDVIVSVGGNSLTSFAVAGPDNDLNFYETTVTDCGISIGTVLSPCIALPEDFDFNYEIGNKVWVDSNNSTNQNAGEPPLGGVNVDLYDAAGILLAQTTTDPNGLYYFNNTNVTGGITQNTTYYIVFGSMGQFDSATNLLDTGDGNEYELVGLNTMDMASGNDASIAMGLGFGFDGLPYIEANFAKDNNHDLDAGFRNACPTLTDIEVSDTNCGTFIQLVADGAFPSGTFFQWSNGASGFIESGTDGIYINVSDTYGVTVTYPSGCQDTYSEDITSDPNSFGATFDATPACGGNNGSIQINASGPNPITYDWANDAFDGMSMATGLAPGIYNVIVSSTGTDGMMCTNTVDIIVPDDNPTLGFRPAPSNCNDRLEVFADEPFPSGTYFEWSNGQAGYIADTADDIYVNVSGTYSVTITYPNGCVVSYSETWTADPDGFGVTVDVTPSCSSSDTGAIDISASTNNGTITYDWDDDTFDGMSTVTGLAPGEYRVRVTNTNSAGQTCNNTMTIRVPEAPEYTITTDVVGSTGCTVGIGSSIDIEIMDGVGPFTYDWDNDGTGDFDDAQDLSNIPLGTYTLVVRDGLGCEQTTMANIPFIGMNLDIQVVDVTNASCGQMNGQIDISVSGGSGNYEYDWDTDEADDFDDPQDITGLSGGNYVVVVRDIDTGCANKGTASVSEEGSNITLDFVTTSFCDANRPGAIDMTINTAATFPLFSIEWDNDGVGDNNDTEDLNNLTPGTYNVTVTDAASGCMAIGSATITDNDLEANRTRTPSCDGSPTASIDLTVTGGVMPYMIDWDNDGTGDFDDPEDLINLPPDDLSTYTAIVEDAEGCRDTTFIGTVVLGGVLLSTEQIIDCESLETQLIVDGNFLNRTTIEWSTGVMGTRLDAADTITVAVPATYTVTVTKLNGCSEIGTFDVAPLTSLMLDFTKIDACPENISGSIDMTISGGLAPYMIDWDNDGTGDNDDMEDLSNLAPGTYTVMVTDANGCSIDGRVEITSGPEIKDIITTTDECGNTLAEVIFENVEDGAFFEWSNGTTGFYNDPNFDPEPFYVIDQLINLSGTYSVTITNPDGCSVEFSKELIVMDGRFAFEVDIIPACGGDNGSITIIPSGGSLPYDILWFSGLPAEFTQNNLPAGDYYVVVTDAANCLSATMIRVPDGEPSDLEFTTTQECVGDNNFGGTIDMTITGGNAPYIIDWDNDGTGDNDDPEDLSDLSAGTYNVTVTSVEGCVQTGSVDIGTQSPQPLIIGNTQICPGEEEIVYLQNVDPNYTIEWSTGTMGMLGTGDTIRVTEPGLYTVTLTNTEGCSAATAITITPTFNLFVNAISEGCNNELGRIEMNIIGDSGPFTIDWDNDGIGDNDDDANQPNLAPGTYNVTVTDSNGCQQTASATVDPFDAIIIGTLAIDPLCEGVPGTVSVFVGGDGRPPFTFLWSPNAGVTPGVNTSIATDLEAGNYSVTVVDAVGCREEAGFVLEEPIIDIDITANITEALCLTGANDGAIDITVTGGVEPYSFEWSNGATTGDINMIGVGTYMLTVTDVNGCFKEASFDVAGFLDLEVVNVQNVCGDTDTSGAIDVTVTGGSGTFTYDWDNDGIGDLDDPEDITGLTAGVYNLNVQDENLLCTGVISAEVLNVHPGVVIVGDTTICEGQTTTLQALGNIYNGETIAWNTGQIGTVDTNADTINVNTVGIYSVITTSADPAACMDTAFIRVVPAVEIFVTPQNIGCNGELGTIDLQINGDSGPYEVDWDIDGVGDFDDTEDLINLSVGTYNVSVANANGCVVTASAQIEPFDLIANGIVAQDPICNGFGGVIAIFPGGDGRPPFSFEWSDNVTIPPGDNGQLITGLDAGTYTVTVTDANGCQQVESISLSEPTISVEVTANITDSSCSEGDNDGIIDITPSGGSGSYSYQWSNTASSQDITGLGVGEYIVTITDTDGCFLIDTFNVAGTFELVIDEVIDACTNEGSIRVSPIGISPGLLEYDWSNDGTGDFDDPRDITGLSPGTYNLEVRDDVGCTGTISATVEQAELVAEIIGNPIVCTGTPSMLQVVDSNDGPLSADAVIQWSTGVMGAGMDNITITEPGTYSVTVTTIEGCIDEATFIAVPPYEVFITPENLGCNGELGSIDLNITGETGPYTIDWDIDGIGDNDDDEDLTNLAPGNYMVTVTDNDGCAIERTVEILPFERIIIGTVELDPLCEGVNGTVGVFVGGDGRAPFTYIWSPNAGVEFGDNVAFINDLEAGIYNVTVIDNNGCREEKEFVLNEPIIELVLNTDITPNTCVAGVEDGAIDLSVLGGATPYTYEWSNGENTEDITALPLGTYDLTVTDINGCIAKTEVEIPGMLDLNVTSTSDVCAENALTGSINIEVTGGSGTFEYDWNNDGTGDFDDPQNLTGIGIGNYRVLVRDIASQCSGTIDADIFNLDPDINIIGDTTICGDQVTTLQVLGNITNGEILEWNTGQIGTIDMDVDTINTGDIGIYTVIATTQGSTVCRDTATIRVVPALEVFVNATNLGCNDEPGLIDLQVMGDSGPYLIDWDTDGTGDFDDPEDLTDLAEGTYNVSVVNVDGCVEPASATISPFDLFVNGVVKQDPICDGIFGTIGIFPGGDGRAPFILDWSPNVSVPPGDPGQIVSGLEPGMYSVTVTDFNGCMQADTIELADYTRTISTQGLLSGVSCTSNEMDGAIDLSVSDGGGGYTYSWSNGADTEDIDMLGVGEYIVTVTDMDGCVAQDTFTIAPATQIEMISIVGDTFICNGGTEKDLMLTGSFEDDDQIAWSTGTTGTRLTGADVTTINIEGTYSVTVTNALGCSISTSITVVDESISALDIVGEDFVCGGVDKELFITGDFDEDDIIAWSSGVLGTSMSGADTITINAGGDYAVTLINEFACTATATISVTDEGVGDIAIEGDTFLCDNESKTLSVTGDIDASSTIMWSDGTTGTIADGANQITISSADTYSVTVENEFGCLATASLEVVDASVPSISISGTTTLCDNGSEILTVLGDFDETATITWSDGTTGRMADGANQITVTSPDTYSVTVSYDVGCSATTSVIVTDERITALSIQGDTFICSDDTKTLSVMGDFDAAATCTWSNGITGTVADGANQISINTAGTYSVTVSNGVCSATTSIAVTEERLDNISIEGMDVTCDTSMPQNLVVTGDIDATSTIAWSDGTTGTMASGANQITINNAGLYSVTVTNTFGCSASTSITINNGSFSLKPIDVKPTICSEETQLLIVEGDFDNTATIMWSTGFSGTRPLGGDRITVTSPGTYSVTVSSSDGCSASTSVTIASGDITSLDIEGNGVSCEDGSSETLTVVGDFDTNATIAWSDGTTGTMASGANQITITSAGTYSVTVTNSAGCSASSSMEVQGYSRPSIESNITNVNCEGNNGSIELIVTGNAPFTFDWDHLPGMDNAMNLINVTPNTYTVIVTDVVGCSSTAIIPLVEASGGAKCLPATFTIKPKAANTGGGNRKRK